MSKRLSNRKTAGFTMVEMVVSAAILALVVGGFFATFGGANQYAVQSRLNTSAKIILGSALNDALGTPWLTGSSSEVNTPTVLAGGQPYSTRNEGVNAQPTPRPDGEISLYTSPAGDEVVKANLTRICTVHPERSDMLKISFTLTWTYRGVTSTMSAYTVVTRDN